MYVTEGQIDASALELMYECSRLSQELFHSNCVHEDNMANILSFFKSHLGQIIKCNLKKLQTSCVHLLKQIKKDIV